MARNHSFHNICFDFPSLLAATKFKETVAIALAQSRTEEAKRRTDFANYKDYDDGDWAPMYYGMFTEWYAQAFLNYFGPLAFNINETEMLDVEGSSEQDLGTDGRGRTIMTAKHKKVKTIVAHPGNTVFVQVKGAKNPTKVYTANDGSRLNNFVANATATAIATSEAYHARYLLFTTGGGLHYTLEQSTKGLLEVINYKTIAKFVDNNTVFLNVLREQVGLEPLPVPEGPKDEIAVYHEEHYSDEQSPC